jgi:glutamate-1-semialdehyde 2,1-aminomutase
MTHLERALAVTPGGSQTLSKRPAAFPSHMPQFAVRGEGPYLIANDGRRYLDWIGSLGATPLGYSHPKIIDAVTRQLRNGAIYSLPSIREAEVAEQLVDVIPCAEQIRFLKTGSEACSAAVSIARAATGRDLILCDDIGYHGWHDTFRILGERHPGVPDELGNLVSTFPYNDLGGLLSDFEFHGHRVGAIFLEPARLETPRPGYLQAVVNLAHEHGALVIFDEMILGGRLALAGGSEYFGVTPDLAVYGKAFGAGLPLAFVAGSRELMKHAWPISGTFSGDVLALAACEAMLEIYRTEGVIDDLWANGLRLMQSIDSDVARTRGYPPHFALTFHCNQPRERASVFVQGCADYGVLFHPAIVNASAAMTTDDVDYTVHVVTKVLGEIVDGRQLRGDPFADSARAA